MRVKGLKANDVTRTQTDRQTDTRTGRQTDRHKHTQIDTHNMHTDRHTTYKETQIDSQTQSHSMVIQLHTLDDTSTKTSLDFIPLGISTGILTCYITCNIM